MTTIKTGQVWDTVDPSGYFDAMVEITSPRVDRDGYYRCNVVQRLGGYSPRGCWKVVEAGSFVHPADFTRLMDAAALAGLHEAITGS